MPINVTHVNSRYLNNGGAEIFFRDLCKYFDQIVIRQSICTNPKEFDPEFAKTFPFPVIVGGRKEVREAVSNGDSFICWGNCDMNSLIGNSVRPNVCIYNACGENVVEFNKCNKVVTHVIASNSNITNTFAAKYPNDIIFPGIEPERVKISIDKKTIRSQLGLKDDFVIGIVSRLDYQKRQIWLVDAIKEFPKAKAVFIGSGPDLKPLKEKANHQCYFLGHKDNIGDWLNCLDVLCQVSSTEGCSAVIFEAMCLKIPLIVTNVGAVPDLLTNKSALIINNQKELISAIKELHDVTLRESLTRNAYEVFLSKGQIKDTAKAWQDLIIRLQKTEAKQWKIFL